MTDHGDTGTHETDFDEDYLNEMGVTSLNCINELAAQSSPPNGLRILSVFSMLPRSNDGQLFGLLDALLLEHFELCVRGV